jgi:GTP pyrophosphokinase
MSKNLKENEQQEIRIPKSPVYRGIIDFDYKPVFTGNIEKDIEILLEATRNAVKENFTDHYKNSVEKAARIVYELFKDDRRGDGTMFYTHFFEAAHILLKKFKFYDLNTLVATILHDSIEDKPEHIGYDFIKKEFNKEVADIVDGVTKITSNVDIERTFNLSIDKPATFDDIEIATIKKLLQYGLKNPKIFFVKLADRYHNILTLYGIKRPERRREIALQTINVYLPIVKILEYEDVARELRDYCLFHIIADNPESAKSQYQKLIQFHTQAHEDFVNLLIDYKIEEVLSDALRKISEQILLLPAHKGLFDLYQALLRENWQLPNNYSHFYLLIDIPLSVFDKDKLIAIAGTLSKYFNVLESETLNDSSIPSRLIMQEFPIQKYTLGVNNRKILEVVVRIVPSETLEKLNIQEVLNKRDLKYFYNEQEYNALMEIMDYLIQGTSENKMEKILYYTKRMFRTENIFIKIVNKDIYNYVPKGWTILDLAFREYGEDAFKLITAKVRNPVTEKEENQKFDYVLQQNDEVEFYFSKEILLTPEELENLKPYSLNAINEIRKFIEKARAKKKETSTGQFFKVIKYVGKDEQGVLRQIIDESDKFHINLRENIAQENIRDKFHGRISADFKSPKKMNLFLIELAKIKNVLEISVEDKTESAIANTKKK